jgi:diguanylate cyclase (GGDEF)-like protein
MLANTFGAIAYIAMAFAVNDLAVASETSVLGQRRGALLAILSAGALVQMLLGLAAYYNFASALPALQMLAAVCLVALPLSFWPVVARLKRGQLHILNARLLARARRAEAAVVAARNWLALAEQSGHVGHWQLSVPDYQLRWSDEMYRIHGLWREHYAPRLESALAAFHPVDGKRIGVLLQEAAANQGNFEVAARLRRPDGEIRHVILRAAPALDAEGQVGELNGVLVDVTEPKRAEAQLALSGVRGLPLEDELTGLADRRQFDLSLGYEFKRAVRSRKPLGLVLLEIDHFPEFGAFYGVLEADACLRAVAQAVQAVPRRTGDVVARYGATEIAVLLPLADSAGAQRVAAQILEAVRALALPNAGHGAGVLTASCGAAAFVGMDDLYNPLELTRRAARALVDAKEAGGNRVCGHLEVELLGALAARA